MLALVIRVVYGVASVVPHPERAFQPDSFGYDQLAMNIIQYRVFSMSPEPPLVPDDFRTPVYPGLMALVYLLFGHHPLAIIWL